MEYLVESARHRQQHHDRQGNKYASQRQNEKGQRLRNEPPQAAFVLWRPGHRALHLEQLRWRPTAWRVKFLECKARGFRFGTAQDDGASLGCRKDAILNDYVGNLRPFFCAHGSK